VELEARARLLVGCVTGVGGCRADTLSWAGDARPDCRRGADHGSAGHPAGLHPVESTAGAGYRPRNLEYADQTPLNRLRIPCVWGIGRRADTPAQVCAFCLVA
jgi:hypothetical protein